MPVRVLCAVEPGLGDRLRRALADCSPIFAGGRAGLRNSIEQHDADLVVVSRRLMPEPAERRLGEIRALPGAPEVVVVYEREDPALRASLLRAGCLAVLCEALHDDELGGTLRALMRRRAEDMQRLVRAQSLRGPHRLDDLACGSLAMAELVALARRVVDTDSSLLLLGETGTGKEHAARAIHEAGPRRAGPFLALNCGALPESLLESELFGHERGAFTGATRARRGYFEQADGGTLFLDEIGELPLHVQVKLLRAIETRRVQRLGGEQSFRVNLRIMAATNRDLESEVPAGRFRPDLYYRLAVVSLHIPPLRERREDIPTLVRTFLRTSCAVCRKPELGIRGEAMAALVAYAWPGNVRELINVVERAALLAHGPEIGVEDLPRALWPARRGAANGGCAASSSGNGVPRLAGASAAAADGARGAVGSPPSYGSDSPASAGTGSPPEIANGNPGAADDATGSLAVAAAAAAGYPVPPSIDRPLRQARRDALLGFELAYLTELLRATGGRIGETARRAGIRERSLYDLLKRHNLRKEDFR